MSLPSSPCCRSTQKKKDKAEQMLVPRNKTAGLTFQTVSSLFQETLLSQRGDFKFKTSHPWVSFWPTLSFWSVFGEGRHSPPAKDYHFKGLCQNHIRSMIKFWKLTFKIRYTYQLPRLQQQKMTRLHCNSWISPCSFSLYYLLFQAFSTTALDRNVDDTRSLCQKHDQSYLTR